VRRFDAPPEGLLEVLWNGAYPAIHDRHIPADRWLADYVTTYVQRDVRQVLRVGDLQTFTTFVKLCAGRSAQVLNLSSLGGDCGISHNTARAWLGVLETSFLVFRLPQWHRNLKKQLVKAPKVHFFDTGLLCHLLGIRSADQLRHHPLRGAVFESFVVSEAYKTRAHRGSAPALAYFRDHKGLEVDLVLDEPEGITLVEAKSGATVSRDFFTPLGRLEALLARRAVRAPVRKVVVVHGGEATRHGSQGVVLPWDRSEEL
jgi:predicted AAA+ superfamily ATPase